MKSRIVMGVILSLVIVALLATPVLADTARGRLTVRLGDETKAMGKVVLTTTGDHQVWAEITAKKLHPNAGYYWKIEGANQSAIYPVSGPADAKGNWGGGSLLGPYASGDTWFTFTLYRDSQGSSNGVATEAIWITIP